MFDVLQHGVEAGEKLGADFVDARLDNIFLRTLVKENGKLKETILNRRKGIGITIYYKGVLGYSYTANLSRESVEDSCRKAFGVAKSSDSIAKLRLEFDSETPIKSKKEFLKMKKHPKDVELSEKMEMIDEGLKAMEEYGERISSTICMYGELYGEKYFTNSEGTEVLWEPCVVDLRFSITLKDKAGNLVDASEGIGGSFGIEEFENENSPQEMGKRASLWAKEKLDAKKAPAGEFRALCENRLAGVLAHESFGHLSEADFVLTGGSPLTGKIGERLGSEHVTIVDEGILDERYHGFFLPYDDQGVKTEKTVVMEKGVLKSYLHTRGTSKMLNGNLTGNARAVNFYHTPIPRMKNTYFAPGDLTEEEALELLDTGIYAIRTAGGQANLDGSFLFKATRGYWVEGGEIKYPIKDVTLTGNILGFLQNVEGATKDLVIESGYFGGCGKGGQYPLPVGLGGPKLLISKVRFGGEVQ